MARPTKPGHVRYRAMYSVWASCWVEFDAPVDASVEELKRVAESRIDTPSVCHECSGDVEIGELDEMQEIVRLPNGQSTWDNTHGEYCAVCGGQLDGKGVSMGNRRVHKKCQP